MARRKRLAWTIFAAAGCCGLGLGLLSLAGGSAMAAPGLPGGAMASGAPLAAMSAGQASALAASTRQPVEVMADRTDWQQVFAEPGGGFLAQESAVPVRVQQSDGSWVAVDTTLSARTDGSVAPAATVPGLVLSGGGSGPLFTVSQATGDPAGSVSLSWPYGPLPAPTVSGATATYAGVLPGVNLLVTAQPMGVDAVLQVTSEVAAADPRLATISFPLSAPGLSAALDGQGGVTMKDGAGAVLFAEPPARMWDSAGVSGGGPASPGAGAVGALPPDLGGPVPGDHVGVAAVAASAGSVSLSPVASVLSGPSVVYPVYIDPAITYSHNQAGWLDVGHDFSGYSSSGNGGSCKSQGGSWNCWGDWEYTDPFGGVRAGVWCNGPSNPPPPPSNICFDSYPDSTWGAYRSYLNFNLPSALAGAAPSSVDAQLSVYNVWSYNCINGSSLELWETGEATSNMGWNSKPGEKAWQDSSTKSYGNICNPGGITLNATSAVKDNMSNGEVTLELRASLSSENASPPDLTDWRRFQATGTTCGFPGASTPCLQVFWMHAPDQATAPATEGTFGAQGGQTVTHCATGQNSPDYVNTATPRLDGTVTDADVTQSNNPLTKFIGRIGWKDVTSNTTGPDFGSGTVDWQSGSFTFWDQAPSGDFTDGHEYQWQAYGEAQATDTISGNTVTEDGTRSSPCYLTVDLPSSNGNADVTGTVNVTSTSSWTVGQPGQVMFTDPNYSSSDSDVVGFFYSVGSSQPATYVQASNGTATVTIKPYTMATESVYAQAVDAAGNRGPVNTSAPYTFSASAGSANISTLAYWPLNGTWSDLTGLGNALTGGSIPCPLSGPTPTPGPGYKCTLTGEADTAGGVVSPNSGFTVSAWVNTGGASCATICVAMSQDAPAPAQVSIFRLGYQGGTGKAGAPGSQAQCPCWVFEVWPANSSSSRPVIAAVQATSAQQQGAWQGGWAQLDGVFDPAGLTATLYVNGSAGTLPGPGRQAVTGPWGGQTPPGPLRLGAGLPGDTTAAVWPGNVSDACVFYAPLAGLDISTLYAGGTGDGCKAVWNAYG